jgi:hypothetical protein
MNKKENVYKKSEIQILIREVYIEYKSVFKDKLPFVSINSVVLINNHRAYYTT